MTLILSGTDGLSDIDGSAATPAVRGTDTNTGIFFGADIIGFAEGGAEVARFNADAQFVAAAGTASLPVITTTGDVNTGIFFPAADQVGIATNGVERVEFGNSETVFNDGGASVDFRVEGDTDAALLFVDASTDRVGVGTNAPDALLTIDGIASFGAGAAATPSIASAGDLNTGMWFPAADTIAFSEGGVEAMRIDSSANLKFNSGYGSVATAYGCRAWVNFNGSGSISANQTIRGSGNVSTIFKNASGSYTMNFSTAMPDENYAFNFGGDGSGARGNCYAVAQTNVAVPTASALRVQFYDDTAALANPVWASICVFR